MPSDSYLRRRNRFDQTISALDVRLDPPIDGYERAQALLTALADLSGSTAQIITPESLGADPTGVDDSFDPVKEAIETASANGFRCELRGQYKLVPTSSIALSKGLLLQGGGRLHVVGQAPPVGSPFPTLLDINIAPLQDVAILDITDSVYDFAGANSSDSKVTRLEIAPGDAAKVKAGDEVKIVSQDQPTGGVDGAYQGEFAYVIAVASPYVYLSCRLRYTFTVLNSPRILVLDRSADKAVFMRDLNFSADWDALVANDWAFEFLRIAGAKDPVLANIRMRDGADAGLRLAGCLGAVTEGLAFARFRNAVVTKGIPGYGVRETGCKGSIHIGLRGTDVRHVYTTTTGAGAGLDAVVNGRTAGAQILGGFGIACNAAAWDTHSDADGVTFFGCKVYGSYDGEASSYSGFQLRGRARAVLGEVYDCAVGYQLKREYASETDGFRELIDCAYQGLGDAFIVSNSEASRLAGDLGVVDYAIDGLRVDSSGYYFGRIYNLSRGTMVRIKVKHRSADAAHRGITFVEGSANSTLRVQGEVDIVDASGGTYRFLTWKDTGIVVDEIDLRLVNGSRAWTAWLAPETGYTQPITAHARKIDADTMPSSADGVSGLPNGTVYSCHVTAKGGRVTSNGRRNRVASSGDVTIGPGKSTAPVVSVMVTANSVSSRVTALTAGNVENQLLAILSDPASLQDLEIVPSEGNLIRAQGTITINAKGGAFFVWTFDANGDGTLDGGIWQHVTT